MTERVRRFIQNKYKHGAIVFPSAIRRQLGLSSNHIASALNNLECDGTLDHYFELVCPSCHHTVSWKYKSLYDLPKSELFQCGRCGEKLETEWDLRSVYIRR